ncbi:binding / hydrogen ion transporting ATP synthase [Coccidioides immitis H538.4]|uniref:Binding / hydrogen ion transporting ATP synthase n=1 Tax=Coccidioides immitis H538.4 TaxID=396776 RepID=A0A0J8RI57_COCIT|nr:binding / hydrogen ion transporting ATP synthase [Coccidioides immitis H538.4]
MAPAIPPPNDRKRVKVYELKDNDWFDRGTGFCTGQIFDDEPKILVESEDQPDRMLLETKISRDDGYQKQQETLIVWTEPNGTDMALSFQEAEGCAVICNPIMLPPPELGNLAEIENAMRASTTTQTGRDAISKFVIRDEYILKLLPLVSVAEDLESLPDLHRLCNIMKSLILLNDNTIIELVVSDHVISGVVGALEYDPEFPTHKANHRQYLNDRSRYKEVVPIKDPIILRKIRHTWRLQYLKDVVLARILDDPTFSVLNSLIFFNQVDIVQHLQANTPFLNELFALFNPRNTDNKRKEDAVQFIHQCALIAKNLQAAARGSLFGSFINHGLFPVIAYAVKHPKPALRTTDHDPIMMRGYMLKAVNEKKVPLTDTLIELLHTETDLGVKNQLADAIKVLLDPQTPVPEVLSRMGADFLPKLRSQNNHFDESAKRLFLPLKRLEARSDLGNLTFQEVALFSHLVDILTFFVRQHLFRSRNLMHAESLAPRIAQLLTVPQKHLKLTALKFFRTLISLQDTFYYSQMTHNNTFELILNIVYETMPRDNLLNSACLELFEYVKRENIKPIIIHVVENYREKIKDITYVDTFQNLMIRYDQMQGYGAQPDATLFSQDESTTPTRNLINGGHRWQGVREMDAAEEEYFDASDDEEDEGKPAAESSAALNGSASPAAKPLVDYPDDDDDAMEVTEHGQAPTGSEVVSDPQIGGQPLSTASSDTLSQISFSGERFLERFSEKRRREEDDDDDELIKLSSASKRRARVLVNAGDKSSSTTPAGTGGKKISFNLSMSSATQAVLKTLDQASSHGPQDSQDGTMKGNAAESDSGGYSFRGAICFCLYAPFFIDVPFSQFGLRVIVLSFFMPGYGRAPKRKT